MDKLIVKEWDVDKLIPYARNPRKNDAAVPKMAGLIKEFGFKVPVVIRSDGSVIDGHLRLKAAQALGLEKVPVVLADEWSEAQVKAFRLAVNRSAEWAEWDEELLKLELEDLKLDDFDLGMIGFDDFIIADELPSYDEEAVDNVPEMQDITISRNSDIWALGKHRLLVGDCTKEENYARLLGGDHAALVVTDPPYNVAYKGAAGTIQNDDLGSGFKDFLVSALKPMLQRCDGACYIAMSSSELDALQSAFRECGGHWSTFIIWAKDRFTLGRSDYQRQYEPMLYGWREGAKHFWCGARDQGDVWQIKKPVRNDGHPTVKPTELFERCIRNSSELGGIVLDCFAGSGTTLIACETSGRLARLMEIDPKYADVIVRRWQDLTGKQAVLEGDGRTFEEIAEERG